MKKALLFVVACCCLVLAGCVKDDDFKEVENDFGVTGGDISFGIPLGNASVNAGQLLQRWQNTDCQITFQDDLLTLNYSNSFMKDVDLSSSETSKGAKGTTIPDFTSSFSGDLDIDLFRNFPDISNSNFTIEGIYANIDMFLKADVRQNEKLKKYIKNAFVSNLKITATSEDGVTTTLFTQDENRSITVADLQQGTTLHIMDSNTTVQDDRVATMFKNRPKQLHYEMKLTIQIDDDNISSVDLAEIMRGDYSQYFANSVTLEKLSSTTTIEAHFPLRIKCNDFIYRDTIDFPIDDIKEGLNQASHKLAFTSHYYMAMKFVNTLPLSFTMNDMLLTPSGDVATIDGQPVHLFNTNQLIKGSACTPETVGGKVIYHSTDAVTTNLLVQLSKDEVDRIEADRLVLSIALNTTENGKAVSIRQQDKLQSFIYLLSNPTDEYLKERFGE